MKLKFFLPILAIIMPMAAISALPVAFGYGEQLTYSVSYKAALVPNTDVAQVIFKTSTSVVDSKQAYHIKATGKVFPFFGWFFDLNDTYESWLDATTLKPIKYSVRLREGKYHFNCDYAYDWRKMEVYSTYRNLKNENDTNKTMPLSKDSFDAIALFFNLRSSDISDYKEGEARNLKVVLEDEIRTIKYKFYGRENKSISGMGTFKTLKFSCQLATNTGESFKDGSEFFIWISDDDNKVPLYVESPIRVGTIKVRITGYKNLAHPLDSKIN